MLGLTPAPLSAGVGRRVAVAGPYGHERVTAWQDGADAQRKHTAGGFVSSGRARAPDGTLARLSQTTGCDTMNRRRPRLEGARPAVRPAASGLAFRQEFLVKPLHMVGAPVVVKFQE